MCYQTRMLRKNLHQACRDNIAHGSLVLISKALCGNPCSFTSLSSLATSLRSPRMFSKFSTIVLISLFTCTLETTPSASAFGVADILQLRAQSIPRRISSQILLSPRCHFANALLVPRSRHFRSYITARTERSGVGQRSVSTAKHAQ